MFRHPPWTSDVSLEFSPATTGGVGGSHLPFLGVDDFKTKSLTIKNDQEKKTDDHKVGCVFFFEKQQILR